MLIKKSPWISGIFVSCWEKNPNRNARYYNMFRTFLQKSFSLKACWSG